MPSPRVVQSASWQSASWCIRELSSNLSTYSIASASAFYQSCPQKKSAKPSAFYTFENLQVRRSAFYRRPHLPRCDIARSPQLAPLLDEDEDEDRAVPPSDTSHFCTTAQKLVIRFQTASILWSAIVIIYFCWHFYIFYPPKAGTDGI